jgi:release factor glutamine methyltransferase
LTPLGAHLAGLKDRLQSITETPGLDAQVLLAHILGVERAWVLSHPEAELDDFQERALAAAASRLEAGEPLPYILGKWEFYGLEFTLSPEVLIPRPETELLVDLALDWLKAHPKRRSAADIGTGSGCIAVTLANKVPDLQVVATDVSRPALQVAAENCIRHKVADRVSLLQSDLMDNLEGRFDLICANLPYIPTTTLRHLAVFGREPTSALDGGERGLDLIGRLLIQAPDRLTPEGLLLLEIEASQGVEAVDLARQAFPGGDIQVLPDLAGRNRVLYIQS